MMEMEVKPIGYVRDENTVEILQEYAEGLRGIENFRYLWIFYFLHLSEEKLLVHPKGDKSRPLRGVFSTRSPNRPNRIGFTAVRLISVEGNILRVKGLDALPGSPVIDIKPYAEVYDLPYGSVLSRKEIERRIRDEKLIENYIDLKTQLQPNGFDCTLQSVAKIKGCGKLDFDNSERTLPEIEEIPFEDDWVFLSKGVYRARINEIVNLGKDVMAFGRPRSSLVRCGANILTAVWDAGYKGRSEVGLVVYSDGIWLKRNARILQLIFVKLTEETEPYSGIYQLENIH